MLSLMRLIFVCVVNSVPVEVQTWRNLAANGSDEQVLKYLREENAHKVGS
jgi:hypothetical protein